MGMGIMENLMDHMVCLMDPMKDMVAYLILLMVYLRDHMVFLMGLLEDMGFLMDLMGILDYLTDLMDHLWDRMECLTIPMGDMDTVMDTVMDTITDSSLLFLVYVGSRYKHQDTVFLTSVKPGPLETVCNVLEIKIICIYIECEICLFIVLINKIKLSKHM